MNLNLSIIAVTSASFALVLILAAIAGQRRVIPERWRTSTIAYVLSIGIAGSSTLLSAVTFAATTKHGYFIYYFGCAAMFLMGGLLLRPVYELMRRYNFENLFDLLAFRYRKHWIGAIISVIGVGAIMPLIANPLRVLSSSIALMISDGESNDLPLSKRLRYS